MYKAESGDEADRDEDMQERRRILTVDDDDSLFQMLTLIYGGSYVLERAADLAQARQLLLGRRYDAMILDVQLPDGLGVELLRALRTEPAFQAQRALPVVMLSASLDGEVYENTWELGSLAYVRKPFEVTDLSQAVERALAETVAPDDALRGRVSRAS